MKKRGFNVTFVTNNFHENMLFKDITVYTILMSDLNVKTVILVSKMKTHALYISWQIIAISNMCVTFVKNISIEFVH